MEEPAGTGRSLSEAPTRVYRDAQGCRLRCQCPSNDSHSMAVDEALDRVTRRRRILDELIQQEGIQQYGLFSVTTEGKLLPDGSESASGFVVDADDRVFYFWLDWD